MDENQDSITAVRDENQDSITAVSVSDPIYSTDTDDSDSEYLEVIKNSTDDHKEKHWIKINPHTKKITDIDSDGPWSRAKWLTELLDKLKKNGMHHLVIILVVLDYCEHQLL